MISQLKYIKNSSSLIQDIIDQKDESINYLYDFFYPSIRKYVLENGGSAEDASDVFQDTIITVYQHFANGSTLPQNIDIKAYFFGIARNIFNSQQRYKSRIERNLYEKLNIEDELEIPGFDEELQEIMIRCFSRLPSEYQKILTLYYEDVPYKEIATQLGYKSEDQAKIVRVKAKKKLMSFILSDPDYKEISK
jgi:RNA polymerase sigma factor (sigma-70 family)